ncbi:MAG: alpha-amylase family glycosyl hydrolase, partial [Elusimicrobiota bacterium]
ALLVAGLNLLRAEASSLDKASWGRSAGIYMVLARAYNRLRPGKGFFDSFDEAEFERIRRQTRADTLWLLDIYEIGAPRRWGTGGGSPYSISGYRVKKELGGDEALRRFSERAHKAGMRVMTDFIPNHTSLDSELIKERPEAVLHIVPPQHLTDAEIMAGVPRESFGPRSPVFYLVETDNYPENGRSQDLGGGTSSGHPSVGRRVHKKILVHHPRTDYGDVMWIDMAQIDYSRADARDWEIEQARRVFEDLGVDAVRRDMAYEQTNARFFHRWVKILEMEKDTGAPWAKKEMERLISEFKVRWAERGGAEFWEQFSDATKSRFPASFAIDEVYSNSTEMSRAGSDGVYNKNTHDESMGQVGLYDAMVSRDAGRIRAALRNMAFRAWQRGGAGLVNFIGTHDGGEGNPWDKFGALGRAAAATALLFRPVLIYNGVEQGVGQARNVRGDLSKSVDREKAIPFDIPVAIDWSQREGGNADFLEMVLGKSAEHADLLAEGAAEVLEPEGGTPIVAYTLARKHGKALLVAANFSESPAGARFKMGTPVLKDFGAFEPKAGKAYLLRDFADLQRDGSPKEYRRTGDELLKDGITLLLGPGGTHVMEVTELAAAAPATGPPQKTRASQGGTLIEEASFEAPVEGSSEKGASPKKAPFWKASWADWTQRLTAFSMVPFALLQLPQILKNIGNLAAGNAAALSGLPWMGYSTGILGNMLLLSYFSSQKEKSAAAVQAVGVLESVVVVTQIFLAGFMPAAAFAVVLPVVAAGLVLNALKAFGKLPDKILGVDLWSLWNKLTNLLGFFALPMGFAMSFGLAQAHMAAALAASLALAGAGLYLIVREAQGKMDKLPPALQWVWKKIGAALASLLFMFGPVSQLMNNIANPAGMAGISVETLLLAMAGNLLMLPRALFVKDKLWFAGSSWGAWAGGWAVLLTMMLAGYLSPLFFGSATAALASYMGFILAKNRKAPQA